MTPRTSPPPPPPPSLSAEEQRGRKLLVFCAPVLRCRRISFSVQLSNSKDFSVFLSHSSSSSSSSLQLDPSMSARLWGSPPPCACMCRITHHLWNLDPLWFFLGIFSINARFQSELFVVCAPSEHLHGTFQATRTVSSERSRSLDQNGKFFFRARHIGRCHDGERMSPHIACQVSPLRVYDHNTRYRAFKRTQTTSWRSNEPISPDCECWIIRRTLEAPELCAFTHVCAPGERHESAVRRRCGLYVLILNPTSLPSWCFDAVHFCFTNMMKWQPRKKVRSRSEMYGSVLWVWQ